jgi:hypothetical protein
MMVGTFGRASVVALPLMIFCATAHCGDDSKVECSCADPALVVNVPPERASAVIDVVPSGPACAGVTPTCAAMAPNGVGCVRYAIVATTAGNCHIDVDFSSGPSRFSADLRVAAVACCPGFYAQPTSAGEIEVPSADLDAGSSG